MRSMVVLFALVAAACGSLVPAAQPPHHPAILLDPHGRPLDTAEVINNRAVHLQAKALEGHYAPLAHGVIVAPALHSVVAPAVHSIIAPAAVSHQSRVDVRTSPAVVSHAIATPVLSHSAYGIAGQGLAGYGLSGYGHYLKKRSLGQIAYAAPVVSHVVHAPAAVSHQSRVDVISSPALVSHSVSTPIVSHVAPIVAIAPSAVSHQSRVDVRTSPTVVTSVYAPHSYLAAPVYSAHAELALPHDHHLKKRSLAAVWAIPAVHAAPSAVSHQSRVDVISKPAVAEVLTAPVLSHAEPAVLAAPALYSAPIAHSAIWSTPFALKAAHW